MMAGKNTFLDHNISCNMDMINEFSEGVSGLFMNAQDLLSESQGILSSIEGIAGSIPGEARYAGLFDSIHGCLSKIRMCDMGAIGFQIIGKTNNYVENMYSIDREYAEKIRKSNWNVIKERLSGVAGSNVYSSNPNSVSGNSSSEKDVVLQKKLDKLQYYDKVYNHVQDQKGRDYYQAKMNEYFNAEIQPLLSQKIVIADNMTCKYPLSEEITIGKVYDAWDDVLNISKYCGNVTTYNNTYRELDSNINKLRIQVLDTANTKSVKKISNQIARTNEKYVFNPIVPGGKLDNAMKEIDMLIENASFADAKERKGRQEKIDKIINSVIKSEMYKNVNIVLNDLINYYDIKETEIKYDTVELAIIRILNQKYETEAAFNNAYPGVAKKIEELTVSIRNEDSMSLENQNILERLQTLQKFEYINIGDIKEDFGESAGLDKTRWNEEEFEAAEILTRKMIMAGYDYCFISGMVGNICVEMEEGYRFENSNYKDNPLPDYFCHFENNHKDLDYDRDLSMKKLSEVGLDMWNEYLMPVTDTDGCQNNNHKFGMGIAQWTDPYRAHLLYNEYVARYGEGAYPTNQECVAVETDWIIKELSETMTCAGIDKEGELQSDFKIIKLVDIYPKWLEKTSGYSKEERIEEATNGIRDDYEGASNACGERIAYAKEWGGFFE